MFELPRIGLDSRAELTLRGLTGICFSLFPLPTLPPEVKLLFFKRFPFPSVHALSLFTAAAAAAAAAVKKNTIYNNERSEQFSVQVNNFQINSLFRQFSQNMTT